MASTIPFDPTLVLGNVVSLEKLKLLKEIAESQKDPDVKLQELNAMLTLRRSLSMTLKEMNDMNLAKEELENLNKKIGEAATAAKNAATKYCDAKITSELEIVAKRAKLGTLGSSVETPLDYNQSLKFRI